MCIPSRDRQTEEIFADEVHKVDYGYTGNERGFLKFSLKIDAMRMCLKLIIHEKLVSKFMTIWSNFLPLKKKPNLIDVDRRNYRTDLILLSDLDTNQKEALMVSNERDCIRYSLYANFMKEHIALKKKVIVKKLKDEECQNLPQFINNHSDHSNLRFWLGEAVKYAVDHNCNNDGTNKLEFGIRREQDDTDNRCDGYSLLKCGRCKLARYCSVRCQDEHFDLHSKEQCEDWKLKRDCINYVGEILTNIVYRAHPGPVPDRFSYEEFLSLISSRIFLASFNLFKDIHFRERVFFEFGKFWWSKTSTDRYRTLLKSEPMPAIDIRRQLEDAWGSEPIFDILDGKF